jgi:hypothetical protein
MIWESLCFGCRQGGPLLMDKVREEIFSRTRRELAVIKFN